MTDDTQTQRCEHTDDMFEGGTPLTQAGQINQGDTILCDYKGEPQRYTAEVLLEPGTKREEVIIDVEQNKYFITSMAINGTSWAKNVKVISK